MLNNSVIIGLACPEICEIDPISVVRCLDLLLIIYLLFSFNYDLSRAMEK